MKKILLNWFPPSMENGASASLSVLKSFLEENGYQSSILYWNLKMNTLLRSFFNLEEKIYENDIYKLLPFFAYLAIEKKDLALQKRIGYYILGIKPQLHSRGMEFIQEYLFNFYLKIDKFIDDELDKIELQDFLYIGFSTQFYQWVIGNIVAKKIRDRIPESIIIAGGLGTREESMAFLDNFSFYNYAMWGEGEFPLLKLTHYLDNQNNSHELNKIPNIAYFINEQCLSSSVRNQFVDLDKCEYNYSEFFSQIEKVDVRLDLHIPIEGGRGCHWKKCNFCFLNSGYKYRIKSPERILEEISLFTDKYNIYDISFLDNDIIGNDRDRFNTLLDYLIGFRAKHNIFQITLAEIITKDINFETIKKMSLAGFKIVQIGYESPSDNLLRKINKKNTFSSNLLFIKWGIHFNIKVNGANVLRGLLEEVSDDIEEAIKNLYYLRFFLAKGIIKHNISLLAIAETSPYYKFLSEMELSNYESLMGRLLPKGYIKEDDKMKLLFDFVDLKYNKLWDIFEKIESHYIDNEYKYQVFEANNNIYYREFYNQELIKELEFDLMNDIYWEILEACDKQVLSLDIINSLLNTHRNIDQEEIIIAIKSLKEEGLLYCNDSLDEVVTIINASIY